MLFCTYSHPEAYLSVAIRDGDRDGLKERAAVARGGDFGRKGGRRGLELRRELLGSCFFCKGEAGAVQERAERRAQHS